MENNASTTLQKAYQLIKAGHKQQAQDLLTPIAYSDAPDNHQAWYLLGFAYTDPEQRIHAFEQVLRLDPTNQPAQKQLAKLRAALVVAPITPVSTGENMRAANAEMAGILRWVTVIGGLLLLCLGSIAIGSWWMLRDVVAAPVAESVSVTATPTQIPIQSATRGPILTPSPRPSVTPYPRRATGTLIPTATDVAPLSDSVGMAPTANLTAVVLMPPIIKNSQISVSKSGGLSSGQSLSIPFDIDNTGNVDFILSWFSEQPLVFTLTMPNGQIIDEAYAKAHPNVAILARTKNGYSYYVKASAVGEWKVNLASYGAGQYEVMAHFANTTLILEPGSDKLKYSPGKLANVAVRLADAGVGLPGAMVVAKLKAPRSGEWNVVLTDFGDGFYGFTYQVPHTSGFVLCTITASGENKGAKFTRVTRFSFEIRP